MEIAIGWVVFAIIVGVAANSRGRNGVGWFLFACIISPVLAFLLLVAMPSRGRYPTSMDRHEGKAKQCPFCAEYIQPKAIVCKHCGRDLVAQQEPAPQVAEIEAPTLAVPKPSNSGPSLIAILGSAVIGLGAIFVLGEFVLSVAGPETGSQSKSVGSQQPQAGAQPAAGPGAEQAYRSRYTAAGFFLRAGKVCEADSKLLISAAFNFVGTDEDKAVSKAYPKTTENWMTEGADNFNSTVVKVGIKPACASALEQLKQIEKIPQRRPR